MCILCYSNRAFFKFHVFTPKIHQSKYNKTDYKTHFMLGKNYYMFQRQGSNLRDCQNMYELVPNVK